MLTRQSGRPSPRHPGVECLGVQTPALPVSRLLPGSEDEWCDGADAVHYCAAVAAAFELFGEPAAVPAGHQLFRAQLPEGQALELCIYENREVSLYAIVSGADCTGGCQMSLLHAADDGLKLPSYYTARDRDAAEAAAHTCHLVLSGAQRKLAAAEPHPQTFA